MSFEIGERVTNPFTGPGTTTGPLEIYSDDDNRKTYLQKISFDNSLLGERMYPINKLSSLEGEEPAKDRSQIQKEGSNGA